MSENYCISKKELEAGYFYCNLVGKKCNEDTARKYQCSKATNDESNTSCEDNDNGVDLSEDNDYNEYGDDE